PHGADLAARGEGRVRAGHVDRAAVALHDGRAGDQLAGDGEIAAGDEVDVAAARTGHVDLRPVGGGLNVDGAGRRHLDLSLRSGRAEERARLEDEARSVDR